METRDLKKILVYSLAAVLLGLSLTLMPLATIKAENGDNITPQSIEQRLEILEGTHDSGASTYSALNVEIFAISFVIGLVVYLSAKRKISGRDYKRIRPHRC